MINFGAAATSSVDAQPTGIHHASEDILQAVPWSVPAEVETEIYSRVRPYVRGKSPLRLISPRYWRMANLKTVRALYLLRVGTSWLGPFDSEEMVAHPVYPLLGPEHIYAVYSGQKTLRRVLAAPEIPTVSVADLPAEAPF